MKDNTGLVILGLGAIAAAGAYLYIESQNSQGGSGTTSSTPSTPPPQSNPSPSTSSGSGGTGTGTTTQFGYTYTYQLPGQTPSGSTSYSNLKSGITPTGPFSFLSSTPPSGSVYQNTGAIIPLGGNNAEITGYLGGTIPAGTDVSVNPSTGQVTQTSGWYSPITLSSVPSQTTAQSAVHNGTSATNSPTFTVLGQTNGQVLNSPVPSMATYGTTSSGQSAPAAYNPVPINNAPISSTQSHATYSTHPQTISIPLGISHSGFTIPSS